MAEQIKQLFTKVREITSRHEEVAKVSGDNFNIFQVIDLTTDEVRIHSKFIAELLNPKGSHGQDNLFLNLFIEECGIKDYDTETATVHVEKGIGRTTSKEGGRIDVLIENEAGKKIVIENKIYAGDQANQLVRYHNYSSENVFYLTLNGNMPSEESSGSLEVNKDYYLLSYKGHITNWLEKCKKEAVNLPLLREGIEHYINLIRFLTGKSNNKKMEKQIRNHISSSPENIKTAIVVSNSLEEAKTRIQYLFWQELEKVFKAKDLDIIEKKKATSWETNSNYYQKSRNNKYHGFWIRIAQIEDFTVHYGIEVNHNIYSGFTIEKGGKGGVSNHSVYENIRQYLKEIDQNYQHKNEWWLGFKHTKPKLNFREFSSDGAVCDLADLEFRKKVVSDIVEDAIRDINLLKEELPQLLKEQD